MINVHGELPRVLLRGATDLWRARPKRITSMSAAVAPRHAGMSMFPTARTELMAGSREEALLENRIGDLSAEPPREGPLLLLA
jgi:hypothetical protein